ncbi:hypothetical protein JCM3774_001851 [Rhodotorula dairenensis]
MLHCEGPPDGITRLTDEHSGYDSFRTAHLVPNTPCIFPPSCTENWPIRRRISSEAGELDYAYLKQQYGALEVACIDCEASTSKLPRDEEPRVASFGDLLQLWHDGRGRTKYLKDWHLPLAVHRAGAKGEKDAAAASVNTEKGKQQVRQELYDVPPMWLDDWMNEYEGSARDDDFRFVYAGGGGTFTPLHRDVYCSYSISTQLFGRKRWYLFPPSCSSSLRALLKQAERDETSINCDCWTNELKAEYARRGMLIVEQKVGESIFIPSGWYHSVQNLSHPTVSLNHNWANAHNLAAMYDSLSDEAARCRDAIADVREMLVEQETRRKGPQEGGGGGACWKREWEETVNRLIEQSEGWSWPTFWRMTLFALSNLERPVKECTSPTSLSRWPHVPPAVRPPTAFVVQQVRPLLVRFREREEEEWRWLPGLQEVLAEIDRELKRLDQVLAQPRPV